MIHHYDAAGVELHVGDLVRVKSIGDELFRIEQIRPEGAAVIENLVPGGRYENSSLPVCDLVRATNNPVGPPAWYDPTYEDPERYKIPMPGTQLPCGCHLRNLDYEAVLCEAHLIEANR